MKNAPILLVLDLWSLGHPASWIAASVGLPNHRHVTRIVERARSIKDPRAVLHRAGNGRVIGRLDRAAAIIEAWPGIQIVDAVRPACNRGHSSPRGRTGHCLVCRSITYNPVARRERYLRDRV